MLWWQLHFAANRCKMGLQPDSKRRIGDDKTVNCISSLERWQVDAPCCAIHWGIENKVHLSIWCKMCDLVVYW
jgi:hypothetical protein